MGFTSGFTGGAALTLSVAYLTVLAHQRNREQQAAALRRQTYALTGLYDPLPPTLPPTRAELAAAERAHVAEAAKDRWNAEVEGAVRWVQNADWEGLRRRVGDSVADLLGLGDGGGSFPPAAAGSSSSSSTGGGNNVSAAARSAYAGARDAAAVAGERAGEAKGSLLGALGKGVDKGREAVGLARDTAKAGAAEDQAGLSPEARALSQRYQGPVPPAEQPSVDDVLAARYLPVDQRDQTQLRTV